MSILADGEITAASSLTASEPRRVLKQIRVIKSDDRAIIPTRKDSALRRVEMIQSEMGRIQKLIDELRADVLHLTIE